MKIFRRISHIFSLLLIQALLLIHATASQAQTRELKTSLGSVNLTEVVDGLDHPWGMSFLPDGRLLLTERAGKMRLMSPSGHLSEPLKGVPEVYSRGQGGLLDVALDPDFKKTKLLYFTLAYEEDDKQTTALARAEFSESGLQNTSIIFKQEPAIDGSKHFGGRIVFAKDNTIFLTLGERFQFQPAQDLGSHLGKLLRLTAEGKPYPGNPFIERADARPEIWTLGHRNIQAGAIDPLTNDLWIAEMGPEGGDELNLIVKGKNYGWPVVSWGNHYGGRKIPDHPTRPEFEAPRLHWTPVISPSGMIFYSGKMFPDWKDSIFIGGLSSRALIRVTIDRKSNSASEAERFDIGKRIRDVAEGPDGSLYLITDHGNGEVLKISAKSS